ncbi:hypothetical protein PPYR_03579 [Photinus pyralis]|uniref:Uncharacterized protein n=1 Tax=Photinus pyralis TaxID=7054 RepID=A0A5N4A3D0_PHOPY|nr:uncharacterized protein LOC116161164 [Photinus pyralis]KAB0791779.1 hypothetical protein PPYR_03579 [Photinus pyralis]
MSRKKTTSIRHCLYTTMQTALITIALIAAACAAPQLRHGPRVQQFVNPADESQQFQQSQPQPAQFSQTPQFPSLRRPGADPIQDDYEIYQNQNAKYEFSSNIDDRISDLTNQRQEVRDGAAVKGSYSYSDGYFKIKVDYIADDQGYRVTGMEAVPLEGPKVDPKGTASVSSTAHGSQLRYRVASIPVPAAQPERFPPSPQRTLA